MLSAILQLAGFAAFVYGTYVLGGRGPAAFVAGLALLVVGQAADGISVVAWVQAKRQVPIVRTIFRVKEVVRPVVRDPHVYTNGDLDDTLQPPTEPQDGTESPAQA